MKKLVHKKIKRENYWEPLNKNMYDCCYCMSKDCACPCGRKPTKTNVSEPCITMSDFSPICDHYVKDKIVYQLVAMRPRIDPLYPHQKNNGYFIEKEVELSQKELEIIKCDEYMWAANHNLGVDSIEYKLAKKIEEILEVK